MPPQLALLPSDRKIGDKSTYKTNKWRNIFFTLPRIFFKFFKVNHDFLGKYKVVKNPPPKKSTNKKTCNLNGFSDLICGITFSYHIK